jgi:hypothetical protein
MSSNTMHLQGLTNGRHSAPDSNVSRPSASPRRGIHAVRDDARAASGERAHRSRERSLLRDPALWAWLIVAMLAMIPAGAALRAIAG